jgi:hypothetical protein
MLGQYVQIVAPSPTTVVVKPPAPQPTTPTTAAPAPTPTTEAPAPPAADEPVADAHATPPPVIRPDDTPMGIPANETVTIIQP